MIPGSRTAAAVRGGEHPSGRVSPGASVSAWSVNVLVPSARSQSVTRMVTLASPSLRLFTTHQAPAPGGQSWHATCGSMMGSQSPRVSALTGQGLNSVMYAQSGNCAGARSPQVAKATIAQIAAILGFMLNLCLHTENYTSTCNLLGGSLPENTAARKP